MKEVSSTEEQESKPNTLSRSSNRALPVIYTESEHSQNHRRDRQTKYGSDTVNV